jgi:Tfp pilus assembly protein PilN
MIKINLLAEKRTAKARARRTPGVRFEAGGWQTLLLGLIFVAALGFIGIQWWRYSSQIEQRKDEKAQKEAQLQQLQKDLERVKQLEAKKAAKERRFNLLRDLKAQKQVPVYVLQQVNDAFGDINQGEVQSIWLTLLSGNKNKLSVRGQANTFNDVSELWNRLNENPVFENVLLGQTIKERDTINFTLDALIIPEAIQLEGGAPAVLAGEAPAEE